ncbi:hypothetical protein BHM03_00062022 [Ensete ventricosum]|nr:hypothetical protein BHM03_00062022 [Ensete ventricosum]
MIGSGGRDGKGERLLWQGRKKGTIDEGGEEEGATVTGEGTAEEEVTAATRATVGEVSCGREGRKKVSVIPIPFQDREGGDRLSSSFQGKLVGSDGDVFVVYYNTDWKSTAATAEGFQGEEVGTVASRSECEQLGRSYLIHRWLPGRGGVSIRDETSVRVGATKGRLYLLSKAHQR